MPVTIATALKSIFSYTHDISSKAPVNIIRPATISNVPIARSLKDPSSCFKNLPTRATAATNTANKPRVFRAAPQSVFLFTSPINHTVVANRARVPVIIRIFLANCFKFLASFLRAMEMARTPATKIAKKATPAKAAGQLTLSNKAAPPANKSIEPAMINNAPAPAPAACKIFSRPPSPPFPFSFLLSFPKRASSLLHNNTAAAADESLY